MKPYPPLATVIVAAVLRARGYHVEFFDAMLSDGVADFVATLDSVEPGLVAIVEDNFNYLTKMCTERMCEDTRQMVEEARRRDCFILVNGSHSIDHPRFYLEAGADAVVMGEPEGAISELVACWAGDGQLSEVAGLALLVGGEVHRTHPRTILKQLDALPSPAWDLVDAASYRRAWTDAQKKFSWNMVASRGCPYSCNWCSKPVFGTQFRHHSASRVAADLRLLRETVRPDHIWFADDIFGLTSAWLEEFGRAVQSENAVTPFMMQTRVNLMKPRTVEAIAAAGAEEVWLGVESGAQSILDAMEKGSTVDQARDATRNLKKAGVRVGWFIQLGYPGEKWDDIMATRDLIRDERPSDIGVSVAYPLPGTKFYDNVRRQLGEKTNWAHSDDLAMMFSGTYTTEFYRDVRTLLHDETDSPSPDGSANPNLARRWADMERRGPGDCGDKESEVA